MTWRQKIACFAAALLLAACRLGQAPANQSSFFFIQMSDPQFGFITANADFERETVNFVESHRRRQSSSPAFVVVTGDLTHRQGDTAQIAEYRRIVAQLDPSIRCPQRPRQPRPRAPPEPSEHRRVPPSRSVPTTTSSTATACTAS